mmetsp:Transcript_21101/g.46002  ORF Transcript_21101/g.46002 Transcript_21101/m.46002 type:complete len:103 (+) Transcript_21101:93-401(+)
MLVNGNESKERINQSSIIIDHQRNGSRLVCRRRRVHSITSPVTTSLARTYIVRIAEIIAIILDAWLLVLCASSFVRTCFNWDRSAARTAVLGKSRKYRCRRH